MALADLSAKRKDVWAGGAYIVKWFQTGDALLKPGYIGAEDDSDEVKICPNAGVPGMVMGTLPTLDIDTLFAAGIAAYGFLIGSGALVYTPHDATVEAAARGALVISSVTPGLALNGTTAGRVIGSLQETLAAAADQWHLTLI